MKGHGCLHDINQKIQGSTKVQPFMALTSIYFSKEFFESYNHQQLSALDAHLNQSWEPIKYQFWVVLLKILIYQVPKREKGPIWYLQAKSPTLMLRPMSRNHCTFGDRSTNGGQWLVCQAQLEGMGLNQFPGENEDYMTSKFTLIYKNIKYDYDTGILSYAPKI